MALIRIPSKNIYQVENNKVIDNNIDYIEVSVNNVVDDASANSSVYEESFSVENEYSEAIENNKYEYYLQNSDYPYSVSGTFSYVEYNSPKFMEKEILIPKTGNNHYISKLILGVDNNGDRNINVSYIGTVTSGNIDNTNYSTSVGGQWLLGISGKTITYVTKYPFLYVPKSTEQKSFTIPYSLSQSSTFVETVTAKTSFIGDNLAEVKASEVEIDEKYYYKLNIKFVVKVTTVEFYSSLNVPRGNDYAYMYILPDDSKYSEYEANIVNITFLGNTIGIDLQENTLSIGNGKEIYSFEGNELIQTTNTPTIQEKYQGVIDSWRNGKETATLRLAIDDYYSENEQIPVKIKSYSKSTSIGQYILYMESNNRDKIEIGDSLVFNKNTVTVTYLSDDGISFTGITRSQKFTNYVGQDIIVTLPNRLAISPNQENYPMTFHIGDIVVPYVYVSKGVDRPISLNADGTPKKFEVIGIKMIYDGAVWQELQMREYVKKKELPPTPPPEQEVKIRVGSILSGGGSEDEVYLEAKVVSGTINVDDILVYNGEEALVTEDYDTYYEIRCNTNGAFQQASGQIIQVTIKS